MERAGLSRSTKGGHWFTGVVEHDSQFLIFASVGTPGRTGHNYDNRWEGDYLHWSHRNGSRAHWPCVKRLLGPGTVIHLFSRTVNTAPFKYHGYAVPFNVEEDITPVRIVFAVTETPPYPEDFGDGAYETLSRHREGAVRRVEATIHERNRSARQKCINHYGPKCIVCDLVFENRYGKLGEGYIQVHHLVPLSMWGEDYEVDPIKDLRPICPNCHGMVHQRRPSYSVEYVQNQLVK